jgi:nucleoside-diphosphate-sugar epimerase
MRILITGVTGDLGRSVARSFLAAGHDVSGIATHGHRYLESDVDFVCARLDDPVFQDLADDADIVLHLAPVDAGVPGSAGIPGLVRVTHAAARAGARLIFPSHAAGEPELYGEAEELVSTGWAPSLIVRMAPTVGRQLDWMVCRTVATFLTTTVSRPVRVLHIDDLHRFLVEAVITDRTGTVDLATFDATNVVSARRNLQSVDPRPRARHIKPWTDPAPELNMTALQRDWDFRCGWRASDAVADTAHGLRGRRLRSYGATELPGRNPLPLEAIPRATPADQTALVSAAPDGLEGEFDDRIDPRFPVFNTARDAEAPPGPLTPMSLDVQLAGLRMANRATGQLMALGGAVAREWESRAVAVFGHRIYLSVSTGVLTAALLPRGDENKIAAELFGRERPDVELFPLGRPATRHGLANPVAVAALAARLMPVAQRYKANVDAYAHAATTKPLDAAAPLTRLTDGQLDVRIRLLRAHIHHGWTLSALGSSLAGIAAQVFRAEGSDTAWMDEIRERVARAVTATALPGALRRNRRLRTLAEEGRLDTIRAEFPAFAYAFDGTVPRIAHRGPREAELAGPVFGDDPALVLPVAARVAEQEPRSPIPPARPTGLQGQRILADDRADRDSAHDATMRFTHALRMALRELASRRVAAELLDTVDDVFYLTCDEALAMPRDARLRIKRRRAERDRLQALRMPDIVNGTWAPLADRPTIYVTHVADPKVSVPA